MATQFDPIAKDESLNTTESPSRNVADVLAQGLDAIEQAIAGGSGSGGHTIVNASGTDMEQRAKMQFVDAGVTDDSTNNKTKVEVVQLIDDEDELDDAPDGVYQGDYDDAPEDVLDASMVAYKDGSVEDALDDSMYRAGDTFTLQPEADAMYGYVRSSMTIRVFLPLRKPIDNNATVSATIPSSFGIATIGGSVTLSNCTVDRIVKNKFGLYLSISFSANSSLVATTPIICGIDAIITFS